MIVLVTGGASSGKSAFAESVACSFDGRRYYLAAMKPYGEDGARRIARHRALRAGKGFKTIECYDGLGSALAACAPELRRQDAPPAKPGLTARRCGEAAAELAACGGSDSPRSRFASAPRSPGKAGGASCRRSSGAQADATSFGMTALLESLGNVVANEMYANDWSALPYDAAFEAIMDGIGGVFSAFDNVIVVGDEVGGDGIAYGGDTDEYVRLIGSVACTIAARADVVVECVAGQPFVVKGALHV